MSNKLNLAILALASAAASLASASAALAEASSEESPQISETASTEPQKRGPGRPPKSESKPESAKPEETGVTDDEMKVAIKPLVDEGKSSEVKKLVKKYGGASAERVAEVPQDKRKDFLADVEALKF